jgi:hypothetical protein
MMQALFGLDEHPEFLLVLLGSHPRLLLQVEQLVQVVAKHMSSSSSRRI